MKRIQYDNATILYSKSVYFIKSIRILVERVIYNILQPIVGAWGDSGDLLVMLQYQLLTIHIPEPSWHRVECPLQLQGTQRPGYKPLLSQ